MKLTTIIFVAISTILFSGCSPASISDTRPTTFGWKYTCGGGDCNEGTFLGGDKWIAPKNPGDEIRLISATTSGADAGLEINPTNPSQQGFLSCPYLSSSYSAALDFSSKLPMTVTPNSSIVKAAQKTKGCQPASSNCCIDKYEVLTVLATPPPNNGATAFRPGMAGTYKRIFQLADFDFSLLPSDTRVNATGQRADFSATEKRWFTPFADVHVMAGEAGRSFVPTGVPDYGATMGAVYLNDLIRTMGTESLASKQRAVEGLIQRGIDVYASYKAGIRWHSGAGQYAGRKPPVAFFAALLVNDPAIKAEVQATANNNGNDFQEDGQISINMATGKLPVWGDSCTEDGYWSNIFYAQNFDGGSGVMIGSGDNSRTCGDPYGYIDGPGGLPGTFYMPCCSTGEYISYQLAQSLMPAYCSAANDPQLSIYTRRVLTAGVHTQPDACAPPDTREPATCAPYAAGHPHCLYYGVTWGPDPNNAGECIHNNSGGNTGQTGRFTLRDGYIMPNISNESPMSTQMRQQNGVTILNGCNP